VRELLIAAWLLALAFFVWEFVFANRVPNIVGSASPLTIRLVDVAFAVTILSTIYYLIKH